jgi:hypothetical protein
MPRFNVHVRRTEDITFAIDADDRDDAEARYLSDGVETFSSPSGLDVIEIEEVP